MERFDHAALNDWYIVHGRHDLPWRQTRDPYAVLISEVMLQQTQVDRVIPHYLRWLDRWPTVTSLAAAGAGEVIRAWSGLGYNRRALNLHRAAVTAEGTIPVVPAALRELPGVGPYTAAAVASFAGESPVAVVDTNIGRVLGRSAGGTATARDLGAQTVHGIAEQLCPAEGQMARHHNLALMDLGAMVCRSRSPDCSGCPLQHTCRWRALGHPSPVSNGRKAAPPFETTARFARGRIVEALRSDRTLTARAIAERLPGVHAERLDDYLGALLQEGLVVRTDETYSLPGDGGADVPEGVAMSMASARRPTMRH